VCDFSYHVLDWVAFAYRAFPWTSLKSCILHVLYIFYFPFSYYPDSSFRLYVAALSGARISVFFIPFIAFASVTVFQLSSSFWIFNKRRPGGLVLSGYFFAFLLEHDG